MRFETETNERGFTTLHFFDRYGLTCSLQKSSMATEEAVWLGITHAEPVILASKAAEHGVETDETTGWVPFPVPEDVLMHTRMHLTQEQVAALLPILQRFVETGEVAAPRIEEDRP